MAQLCKLVCILLFMSLTCTSLTTSLPLESLSLQKVVGMIEAAKKGLSSQISNMLKKAEEQMTSNLQTIQKNVSNEFEERMQKVTKQLITDILVEHNILGEQMLEIRSCLSHLCENGGKCHETADTCMCLTGYAGAHCENCNSSFVKKDGKCVCPDGFDVKDNTCVPDGRKYLAVKPYQESKYVLSTNKRNWNAARDACKELKGDLVATETQEEWSQIFDEIKRLDAANEHWLGATGQGTSGQWAWVSGGAITSSPQGVGNWYSSQPNNSGLQCMRSGNNGDGYYSKTNNWIDQGCSSSYKFICEY